VVKSLFPGDLYPNQETLKEALRNHLEEKYPDFMANLSPNAFINKFHEWGSSVSVDNYRFEASIIIN
jgi:hypothetical protein